MATDSLKDRYNQKRIEHWDQIAGNAERRRFKFGNYYHWRLEEIYKFWIPPNQRVIELGCAEGNLLAAVDPAVGVGVDSSREMVALASQKYPGHRFIHADVDDLRMDEPYDVVILSELINDL